VDTLHIVPIYPAFRILAQGFNGPGYKLRVDRKYPPNAGVTGVETFKLRAIDLINIFIFVLCKFFKVIYTIQVFLNFISSPLQTMITQRRKIR
jgi:hypothetical protein